MKKFYSSLICLFSLNVFAIAYANPQVVFHAQNRTDIPIQVIIEQVTIGNECWNSGKINPGNSAIFEPKPPCTTSQEAKVFRVFSANNNTKLCWGKATLNVDSLLKVSGSNGMYKCRYAPIP